MAWNCKCFCVDRGQTLKVLTSFCSLSLMLNAFIVFVKWMKQTTNNNNGFCHFSSWEWPFPWHCSIRSTEAGRSMMPNTAVFQGRSSDALWDRLWRTAPPLVSNFHHWPAPLPIIPQLTPYHRINFSHGPSLFHSFSPICSSAKETRGQRGMRRPAVGQHPPHEASDFLHLL